MSSQLVITSPNAKMVFSEGTVPKISNLVGGNGMTPLIRKDTAAKYLYRAVKEQREFWYVDVPMKTDRKE